MSKFTIHITFRCNHLGLNDIIIYFRTVLGCEFYAWSQKSFLDYFRAEMTRRANLTANVTFDQQ